MKTAQKQKLLEQYRMAMNAAEAANAAEVALGLGYTKMVDRYQDAAIEVLDEIADLCGVLRPEPASDVNEEAQERFEEAWNEVENEVESWRLEANLADAAAEAGADDVALTIRQNAKAEATAILKRMGGAK